MSRPTDLSCRCGKTQWRIAARARGTKIKCFCADCQTFARHLRAEDWLDDAGGTTIFHTVPHNLTFTGGLENLEVLRLSPKGALRWYAACCGTPIGNTLATPAVPFLGAILPADSPDLGKIRAEVQTTHARKPVKEHGFARTGLGIVLRALGARLAGKHRETPLFDAKGAPVRAPFVLTRQERKAARPS
ncbi:DUF6151 family protein [Aestuariicoccus sp. MJ-SS9]|uniref:DUF6151 family protein n=1 Tax=Aestuariicoccus sp. MJ-SS9 TaxID=3079855 RepID=UPI00290EA601|nr:DUF6151 family protein [Aestuariicoccus sp. MJ-SS9]MDU8913349.1 DUF6151 family protein [Aestuariicoccus sp. MJ-SS9]